MVTGDCKFSEKLSEMRFDLNAFIYVFTSGNGVSLQKMDTC